jgi:hypothetical protein
MPSDRAQGANPSAKTSAGAARRLDAGYELRVSARRGVVTASVTALRAQGALRVAEGRPVGEAAGLAGMLFPMSAAAQTAAALAAVEAALKVTPPQAQIAARDLLVGLEAAAACAWRMGFVWPQLNGGATSGGPVQDARAAADAAAGALFVEADWARIGGGRLRPSRARARELAASATSALEALAPALDALIVHAPPIASLEGRAWPLLDEAGLRRAAAALAADPGFSARPHLAGRAIEEGPRALLSLPDTEEGLPAWFRAQARFAAALPARLERALDALADAEPASVNVKGSGKGWGQAVTARGRMIHWIAVERGKVAAWRALEPTDWNFAPRGPVARAAELLPPDGDLADAGRWVAAAFDPSAPCRIVVEADAS